MSIQMRLDLDIRNPFATISIPHLYQDLQEVELRWARKLRTIARVYPKPRAGQKYVRMFVFKGSWVIAGPFVAGGDIITDLTNDTPYGPFVVGNAIGSLQNQAYHAGRWYLFRQLVEASAAEFVQDAQAVINRALGPAIITP